MQQLVVAVIDDDALVRGATSSLIRSFGYSTACFDSAEAFLAQAAGQIACVVSDQQMPGRTGLELCRVLQAEGAGVPMILMTAFPTPELRDRATGCNLVALLEKPVDAERLGTALASALG